MTIIVATTGLGVTTTKNYAECFTSSKLWAGTIIAPISQMRKVSFSS